MSDRRRPRNTREFDVWTALFIAAFQASQSPGPAFEAAHDAFEQWASMLDQMEKR